MLNSKFKNDYFKDVKETFNLDIVAMVKNLIKFNLDQYNMIIIKDLNQIFINGSFIKFIHFKAYFKTNSIIKIIKLVKIKAIFLITN